MFCKQKDVEIILHLLINQHTKTQGIKTTEGSIHPNPYEQFKIPMYIMLTARLHTQNHKH